MTSTPETTEAAGSIFTVNGKLAMLADVAARYCGVQLAAEHDACIMAHMLGITADSSLSIMPLAVPGELIDSAREGLFELCLGKGTFTRMLFFCEAWVVSVKKDDVAALGDTIKHDPRKLEAVVFDGRDADGNRIKCSRLIDRETGTLGEPRWVPPETSRYMPSTSDDRAG